MVHRAAETGYQREATTYASARPAYHPALVQRFVDAFGQGETVEIGAGTGIFTRQLVAAGCAPIAIEPVDAMRAQLAESLPSLNVRSGTAEATGLPENSADTVVVAQAFHWFDHRPALAEIRRILRPDGYLVCTWNVRDQAVDWMRAYTEIMDLHRGSTPSHHTMIWRDAIEAASFTLVDDWSIPNPVPTTGEDVARRVLSTSFIAALDAGEQQQVLDDVATLTVSLGERFDFPYRSELQAWR